MKTFVITLSKTFPRTHIHSGRETYFAQLLNNGLSLTEEGLKISRHKIHTVRTNLPLWEKRISEIQRGQAVLSIREWTGRPYGSPQKELARLTGSDGVGIQVLKLENLYSPTVIDGEKVELSDLAAHDGLSLSDWYDWFRNVDLRQPMAIIHFTKFRYGKTNDTRRRTKIST